MIGVRKKNPRRAKDGISHRTEGLANYRCLVRVPARTSSEVSINQVDLRIGRRVCSAVDKWGGNRGRCLRL
ncbi:hypothetical protein CRG98_019110 [Punica granatum]|uniref:Uncharacterized protein n=1 Tax=Punica granatum TaxID=22663 RepID=A0A2I0JYD3_PUNGR|nr:hypothetical protein CRG98_019110 [Punica granatum]